MALLGALLAPAAATAALGDAAATDGASDRPATIAQMSDRRPPLPPDVQQRFADAVAAHQRGDTTTAIRLQLQVVAWARANLGQADLARARALSNLAAFQGVAGHLREAVASSREAVEVFRRLAANHPAQRPDLGRALQNLASFLADLGDNSEALAPSREAVALSREQLRSAPSSQGQLAAALSDLSTILSALGRNGEALNSADEAVALLHPTASGTAEERAELARVLMNQGAIARRAGQPQRALEATAAALPLLRRLAQADPSRRADLAWSLDQLAVVLSDLGRSREALAASQDAVALLRDQVRSDPSQSGELARLLSQLGNRHGDLGQLAEGLARAEEAVALQRTLARRDPGRRRALAQLLINLSKRLTSLGRDPEALAALQEATALSTSPGPRDGDTSGKADLATALANQGALLTDAGNHREAITALVRAIDFYREVITREPTQLAPMARALLSLGSAYQRQGQNQEAVTATRLGVQMFRDLAAASPAHRDDLAGGLNNLGNRLSDLGQEQEAWSTWQEGLTLQRQLAHDNPAEGQALALLAMNAANHQRRRGDRSAAVALLQEMVSRDVQVLQSQLPLLPERRRQALLQTQAIRWQIPFAMSDQGEEGARLALFTRLNRHGLLQEIQRTQTLLARAGGAPRTLLAELAALNARLASGALADPERQPLQTRRDALEQQLYQQLPALQPRLVQPAEIQQALPTGALLVEFQRYRPHDPRQAWERSFGPPCYVALLLHADGRLAAVPLGPAAPVDAAIAAALDASANNYSDAHQLWAQVSQLLLTPLQPQLAGVRELFLSPDGELNRVPFAALPLPGSSGRLLSELLPLRLLTTGRDLLRLRQGSPAAGPAVVIAAPDYDLGGRTTAAPSGTSPAAPQRRRATPDARIRWQPLPGTAAEARLVAPLLGAGAPITGSQATVARALQQHAPRVLHIATHGFFQPDATGPGPVTPQSADRDATTSTAAPAAAGPSGGTATGTGADDPLLRSGLVLAGANRPDADPDDDGYLTAAEATGMDLNGTQLVTLSACETGLGSLRSGEGVYGLQRALAVAGARSTLLSLWKVDDAATAAFMADFYARLRQGEGRAEALAATQAAFRAHPDPLHRDVHVWGAFQLSGDWRALPSGASGR